MFSMALKKEKQTWLTVPPWIILGAVGVMAVLFTFMTLDNIHREKENTTQLLLEKGAALIRAFEAGTRTGMMGMMMGPRWGTRQLQRLLTETAKQPDVVYLAVTDDRGRIVAHSDDSLVGGRHAPGPGEPGPGSAPAWRRVTLQNGAQVFEVYRTFTPLAPGFHDRGHGMMRGRGWCEDRPQQKRWIFVGLDMETVEKARLEDLRHTVVMALILLLIGFAGIFSLFVAHAYRSARSSLSRARAFSDKLVEHMPVGLLALDPEGRVSLANRAAEEILGRKATDLMGKGLHETLPQPCPGVLDRLDRGEAVVEEEMDCSLGGDRPARLEVVATRLRDEDGRALATLLMVRDLTQIQRLKEEVARSQRLAAIGSLAAGVAHEIRNPLSSIKGFATYFRDRHHDVPEERNMAEIMIQEVERLNRVIGQLLEFARPIRLERRPTDITALVRHTLKLMAPDARKKGVRIVEDPGPTSGRVAVDPDRLQQVLLNLYLNAIEAMEKGGVLTVSWTTRGEDEVEIVVSDTGSGIPRENLSRIFDPYFTSKAAGTGLGLAIVQKVVESHGGRIEVQSRPGEGTRITLLLPSGHERGKDG
ncbi:MAG: histidine kinase [Deltaproteobacteria bacterium]|nr:MAG: histidine kinase [Deltaproteobacteria bacterium]